MQRLQNDMNAVMLEHNINSSDASTKPTPSFSISLRDSAPETVSDADPVRPVAAVSNNAVPRYLEPLSEDAVTSRASQTIAVEFKDADTASTTKLDEVTRLETVPPIPLFYAPSIRSQEPVIAPKSAPGINPDLCYSSHR